MKIKKILFYFSYFQNKASSFFALNIITFSLYMMPQSLQPQQKLWVGQAR